MHIIEGGRLSYIFIQVRDLDRMLSFYCDILGFHMQYLEEGHCAFLNLPAAQSPQIALYAGRKTPAMEDNHWFIAVDVADLNAVAVRVRVKEVQTDGIFEVPYGRAVKIKDPEGNVIQIHEPTKPLA